MSNCPFKIGDTVRILDNYYGDEMPKGTITTVIDLSDNPDHGVFVQRPGFTGTVRHHDLLHCQLARLELVAPVKAPTAMVVGFGPINIPDVDAPHPVKTFSTDDLEYIVVDPRDNTVRAAFATYQGATHYRTYFNPKNVIYSIRTGERL